MSSYCFSFRSLTAAQRARDALNGSRVPATVLRAPKAISRHGCGFVVEVSEANGRRAAQLLFTNGISYQRVFRMNSSGGVEVTAF